MSAVMALIVSACVNAPNKDACIKALETGMKQSGIENHVEDVATNLQKGTIREAILMIGEDGVKIISSGAFAAKISAEKMLKMDLPTFGLCDSISWKASTDKHDIKISWGF